MSTNVHKAYMPSLDGLRGLACLLVIVCHMGNTFHLSFHADASLIGGIGVFVFFSLSGFLMSALYCDEKASLRNVGHYAIARMTRIAPAYYIAISFAWLLYMLIPGFKYEMTPFMMLRSFAFGGNQGVFWSIPPEIQFYVFFVFLWIAYGLYSAGSKIWIILMGIVCVACIFTRDLWGGLMLPSKLHIFLFGFLAAFLLKHEGLKRVLGTLPFQFVITACAILYAVFMLDDKKLYEDLAFAALVSIGVASLSQSSVLTRPLESGMMRMMGAVSFSVYLFHDQILWAIHDLGLLTAGSPVFLTIAIGCVVSLVPPIAFHYLAERHLHKISRARMTALWEKILEKINGRAAVKA